MLQRNYFQLSINSKFYFHDQQPSNGAAHAKVFANIIFFNFRYFSLFYYTSSDFTYNISMKIVEAVFGMMLWVPCNKAV